MFCGSLDARQYGLARFHGNSVRALRACAMLVEELGLYAFELSNSGSALLGAYLQNE